MKLKAAAVCFLVLVTTTSGAQTAHPTKKAALSKPEARTAATTSAPAPVPVPFVCPDVEAKQSCNSYEELVRAKDGGLQDDNDDRYICFRKHTDEFFVLAVSPAQFEKTWNEKYRKMMVDPSATVDGAGYADSYKDGVENEHILPAFYFSGLWRPSFGDAVFFTATEFNFEKINEKESPSTVSINSGQVSVTYKYQNPMKQDIVYTLTIQRSTGRFVEAYQKASEQIPFSQDTGRCVYQKPQ